MHSEFRKCIPVSIQILWDKQSINVHYYELTIVVRCVHRLGNYAKLAGMHVMKHGELTGGLHDSGPKVGWNYDIVAQNPAVVTGHSITHVIELQLNRYRQSSEQGYEEKNRENNCHEIVN